MKTSTLRTPVRTVVGTVAGAAVLALALAACSAGTGSTGGPQPTSSTGSASDAAESSPITSSATPPVQPGQDATPTPTSASVVFGISTSIARGAQDVRPDSMLVLKVNSGRWKSLTVKDDDGDAVSGSMTSSATGGLWTASQHLTPDASYTISGTAVSTDGTTKTYDSTFSTLTADHTLTPSIESIKDGETYGVAMPVMIHFDHDVTTAAGKANVVKNLKVTTSPTTVKGAWRWYGDDEVHWRPATWWPAHTKVHVGADTLGVDAGDGLWGDSNDSVDFSIGDSVMDYVDLASDHLKVMINGKLARTIPVTGGKPGFTTRYGIKVIKEKDSFIEMRSETIGIGKDSSQYYDLPVHWAMRVTNSGEFLHAAPWSVGSQGESNVSHGCVGMSTHNAHWLFDQSTIGDPVIVTGTSRKLVNDQNAWDDWNVPWSEYSTSNYTPGS